MHMIDTEKVSLPAVATLGNKGSAQSVEELNTATTLLFTTKEEDIEQAGADGAHSSSSSSRQMPEHTKEGKRIVRFRKKDTAHCRVQTLHKRCYEALPRGFNMQYYVTRQVAAMLGNRPRDTL